MARQGGFVAPVMQRYMLQSEHGDVPAYCYVDIDIMGVELEVIIDETSFKPGDKISLKLDPSMSPLLRLMANCLDQHAQTKQGK